MARHARSVRNGSQTLLLDHYLEILAHKPGALAGATALVQARRAGCGALVTAGGGIGSVPDVQHHPHSSAIAREIAGRGTILRVQVGSGVHGTSIHGQDDRDEMGLCLEPPEYVTGVAQVPRRGPDEPARIPFEQYEYHTAGERPGGLADRSGAGDLDLLVYSARSGSGSPWAATRPC